MEVVCDFLKLSVEYVLRWGPFNTFVENSGRPKRDEQTVESFLLVELGRISGVPEAVSESRNRKLKQNRLNAESEHVIIER